MFRSGSTREMQEAWYETGALEKIAWSWEVNGPASGQHRTIFSAPSGGRSFPCAVSIAKIKGSGQKFLSPASWHKCAT